MGLKKNVNVITRNGQNPENKIFILRQWFSFPNLLPRKLLLVASTCFFSDLFLIFLFEQKQKNISSFGPGKKLQKCGLSTRVSNLEQKLFDVIARTAFYVSGGALCLVFS